jgi:UDP-N-acetylmuramoyl-tripeptide--D-alanyl-D-alanine ligase
VIVSHRVSGPHVLVDDTFAALQALGRASRERSRATIFGVTGSVGKTSTKEALYAALDRNRPGKAHRSVKSYNNHTGVPLSLARMPRDAEFAVLEMGMNNKGEIAALTRQVRPHVALITAIAPAHIENLGSEESIADAKAEIFQGLEPEGIAIVPNDTPHRDRLVKAARRRADRIITFGGGDADVHAVHAVSAEGGGSLISAALLERELTFTISQRGEHWVSNALAVLAAVEAVGADVALAGLALADLGGLKGRGQRHVICVEEGEVLLIDESYNANPASMAATLRSLGAEKDAARRIAVLGPMRELGEHSEALHAGLAPTVLDARVDELILIGEEMRPLAEQVVGKVSLDLVSSVDEATERLMRALRPGDAVLVKASNSVGLAKLVERVAAGVGERACST